MELAPRHRRYRGTSQVPRCAKPPALAGRSAHLSCVVDKTWVRLPNIVARSGRRCSGCISTGAGAQVGFKPPRLSNMDAAVRAVSSRRCSSAFLLRPEQEDVEPS